MADEVFTTSLVYRDPPSAVAWLVKAFGFEVTMAIEGPPGQPEMCHYELSHEGRGSISLGGQWADWTRSPAGLDGANTQVVHMKLDPALGDLGVDEHCERARAAGAEIAAEPEEQFYGDRMYRAVDLEGHRWTFAQTVREVSKQEAEEALGQPIEATGWR